MPQTPPWIAPADPVASTAKGLQLGMQLGSEQAAQRFQEQQMMRKEQEDAQAQAQWEAEYGMRAAEVARKHTAMQEYQRRIAAGEDPLKVILEVGPSIGVGGAAEAAAIRAQNQKPAPTWSLIPGLPQGVQALQSSAGGIHVVPAPRPQPQWQDATKAGIPGQTETNSGRFQAFPRPQDDTYRNAMMADRFANELDKLQANNPMFDLTGDADPAWPKLRLAQFKAAKARYNDLQRKLDGLESGAPMSSQAPALRSAPAAEPSTAPSALKISNIRPAGQGVPRGTMPAAPTLVAPPWPMNAPALPAIPMPAPPEMQRAPAPASQPSAPAPQALKGQFSPQSWNSEADARNTEGTNRNFLPKMSDDQLVDTAHQLGLVNAVYDRQDGNFRVWREGDSARKQKHLTRKQFEDAVIQLATEKQMRWNEP